MTSTVKKSFEPARSHCIDPNGFAVGQHDEARQEGLHAGPALRPPLAHQRPLGQLADGDKGDGEGLAGVRSQRHE